MNSSGIKRGLATTAISALAVTGLPFLATSASATPGDVLQVAFTGPALNTGTEGAVVVLKTAGVDPLNLQLIGSDLVSSEDTATQNAQIVGTPTLVPNGDPADSNLNDDLDEITVRIDVFTQTTGSTANFAIYEDEANPGVVDATEPRAQVSVQTTGAVAQIDVSPASQTSAVGVPSAPYTVTIKDSAGRTTQLAAGQTITIDDEGDVANESGDVIDSTEIDRGTDTFTATASGSAALGSHNITVTDTVTPTVVGKATVDVTKAADTSPARSTS